MAISIRNSDFENQWKVFLATGICGGFTTFSAFSYDGIQMIQEGRYFSLLAYAVLSVSLSLAACYGGIKMIA